MSRLLSELELRATLPLSRVSQELRDKCIEIARKKSPSSAFNLGAQAATLAGLNQLEVLAVAKATRWLAVIRRDYGQSKFDNMVKTLTDNTTPKS